MYGVLIEMSLECQSRCWLSVDRGSIKGIDRHLTRDTFSTHDSKREMKKKMKKNNYDRSLKVATSCLQG